MKRPVGHWMHLLKGNRSRMTDSEKLLAYYLMLAIDIIKGEYPKSQWEEYHVHKMEDAIALVAMGGIENETSH